MLISRPESKCHTQAVVCTLWKKEIYTSSLPSFSPLATSFAQAIYLSERRRQTEGEKQQETTTASVHVNPFIPFAVLPPNVWLYLLRVQSACRSVIAQSLLE